ncbi:tRNA(Ile)-lysidine synthase [Allopseudospirillum japonicum]|uniref:tRNA(Ile)-lysidine synthase n=1 Tax=Allopseudospirillum japonicum TaxID=64971 RepID=A0A1H6TZF4_9GAMM|nr:tRNA lysidine(34) synthetase TilS [Allopseudospirillum japonicum]SEI85508.1 tRNA(Ile)-lysidine synthase [Allopseudospirillum japonicum]
MLNCALSAAVVAAEQAPLYQAFQTTLHQAFVQPPVGLQVALSGGMDSSVLLVLAHLYSQKYQYPLQAIHVHHGLSPHADAWLRHCQQLCGYFAIPLQTRKIHLDTKTNLEAQARRARYQVFAQVLRPDEVLLQGHHQQDQAETFLYRALRGAGVRGLGAIPSQRALTLPQGQAYLVRPLLEINRLKLHAFAEQIGLTWVEDESNQTMRFDRNYLRHQVLPVLQARWPQAQQQMALSAHYCQQAHNLLDTYLQADLQQVLEPRPAYTRALSRLTLQAPFDTWPWIRQRAVLAAWLESYGIDLAGHLWAELHTSVLAAAQDTQACLSWQGHHIYKYRQHLYLVPALADKINPDWHTTWSGQAPLVTPWGTWHYQIQGPQQEAFHIRLRQGGEKLAMARRGTQSLKNLLQSLGIPPWERPYLPYVYHQGRLIAVLPKLAAAGWHIQARDQQDQA